MTAPRTWPPRPRSARPEQQAEPIVQRMLTALAATFDLRCDAGEPPTLRAAAAYAVAKPAA